MMTMKMLIVVAIIICVISNINAQSRIAGGDVADIKQYPFATALLNEIGGTTNFQQVCGGTILTNSAILSAASCFVVNNQVTPPATWRARVGSSSADTQGMLHIISSISNHPLYDATTRVNDVAVLRTAVNIDLSDTVQPAYIAGGAYKLRHNDQVMAIGWGATSGTGSSSPELRHVQVWVNDQQTCAERYKTLNFEVTDSMLCAGWLDVGIRGQCLGDNGGPLLQNGVVVGVHSWSRGCADPLFPDINTRVSSYSRWIEAVATAT